MDFVELLKAYGGGLSAVGLLGLGVLMILRGYLIPKSVLESWREMWEARLATKAAEALAWREAYEAERARGELSESDKRKLLEIGEATLRVLQALPRGDTSDRVT